MKARERIIVAVDVPSLKNPAVRETLKALAPHVRYFKIGLELIMAGEADAAIEAVGDPSKIMFDAKLHDIPQTVANATMQIAKKGVGMFTIHASGGERMIAAAVTNKGSSIPLVVTVLTSLDQGGCTRIYRVDTDDCIKNFTMIALKAGAEAIVCAATDIPSVCHAETLLNTQVLKVTPGIRVDWGAQKKDDQHRIMTPLEAVKAGADYLVIGRDIMQAQERHGISPLDAVLRISDEITLGMANL